ncbi:MAG TPA: 2-amino-4-hydroxy-6-hydroxymethyldihydropteridine diphosphokinase [Actinomycetota bacterium]|nr:2-amino-4-hydroxy-6-hydroxymethyldihydropteridine diphosphokinase [Actinomycetota bacterium]
MTRVYVGLGSNLGDRQEYLRSAVQALAARGLPAAAVSSVYESDPLGPPQPDYLNAVAAVDSALPPAELLGIFHAVEEQLGRQHREHWGPREIDIDLLLYGDEVVASAALTVPHPGLTERSFVVVPLLEIAPDLVLPSGAPLRSFASADPCGLRRLGPLV